MVDQRQVSHLTRLIMFLDLTGFYLRNSNVTQVRTIDLELLGLALKLP